MKKFLILLLLPIFLVAGCQKSSTETTIPTVPEVKKITAQEAKEFIDSGNVIILDVRSQEEYNTGHIKNAILIPHTEVTSKIQAIITDKNAKILVYCASGIRSALAATDLINLGYTDVSDFGAISGWSYGIIK